MTNDDLIFADIEIAIAVVNADVGQRIAALMGDTKRLQEARTMSIPVIRFAQKAA